MPHKPKKTYAPRKRLWIVMDAGSGNVLFAMHEPPDETDLYEQEVVYEYELRRKFEVKKSTK